MMLGSFYAGSIDPLVLSAEAYADLIRSPFADESVGDASHPVVIVEGSMSSDLPNPGSLPVVVVWIGEGLGASGPAAADVVVGHHELDAVMAVIAGSPNAARTLAVLLRGIGAVDVETGLALESAAYSMLQSGPEFASWRASRPVTPTADDRPTVVVDRAGSTLTITLDRPHRHNAISTRLRDELSAALSLAASDDTIEHVVLQGNGPSFCSGGDLDEFGSRPDPVTAHVTRLARSPARLMHRVRERATVRLHGAAFGGGVELAAFADRVEAAPDVRIALPEIGLGLIPGAGGTVSITRRIGRQRTAALALSGREIDAATAHDWGLVDRIVD